MGKTKSEPEKIPPISCEILGKDLNQAVKQLKVAFPRKKAEKERASVMIYSLSEGLRFGIPGADVLATATVSNEFIFVIPWIRFKHTFVLPWKPAELIKLEFSDNCISINKVAVRDPEFKFHSGIVKQTICNDDPSQGEELGANVKDTPVISATVDSSPEPPLLDAHFYMKKYGFRPFLENRKFVSQQRALKRALDEASRILEPIGITRMDIEQMIDEKIKKMPGYETNAKK